MWSSKPDGCKIIVKTEGNLNGKIKVKMDTVKGTKVEAFLQPNEFDTSKISTVGITENQMFFDDVDGGSEI